MATLPYQDWNPVKYTPTKMAQYVLKARMKNVWLHGPTGIQKTRSVAYRAGKRRYVRWLDWTVFIRDVLQINYGKINGDIHREASAKALVIIDDFARTDITDLVINGAYGYIDQRLKYGGNTWITSQYSPTEFCNIIGRVYKQGNGVELARAIYRRINDEFTVIGRKQLIGD